MKKFVFTLLLVFVCHLGYAQSINGLFSMNSAAKKMPIVSKYLLS